MFCVVDDGFAMTSGSGEKTRSGGITIRVGGVLVCVIVIQRR